MTLDLRTALSAYARMINTLDIRHLEHLLADDFHYASQNVIEEIGTRSEFVSYMTPKLRAMDTPSARPLAEMAEWDAYGGGPCVVLAQGGPDDLVATVVAEIAGYRISRIDLCVVLSP